MVKVHSSKLAALHTKAGTISKCMEDSKVMSETAKQYFNHKFVKISSDHQYLQSKFLNIHNNLYLPWLRESVTKPKGCTDLCWVFADDIEY